MIRWTAKARICVCFHLVCVARPHIIKPPTINSNLFIERANIEGTHFASCVSIDIDCTPQSQPNLDRFFFAIAKNALLKHTHLHTHLCVFWLNANCNIFARMHLHTTHRPCDEDWHTTKNKGKNDRQTVLCVVERIEIVKLALVQGQSVARC